MVKITNGFRVVRNDNALLFIVLRCFSCAELWSFKFNFIHTSRYKCKIFLKLKVERKVHFKAIQCAMNQVTRTLAYHTSVMPSINKMRTS